MHFVTPDVYSGLKQILENYPSITLEAEKIASGYAQVVGEYNDGSHFVDLELSRDIADDKTVLAARFSLCSFDSVDSVFIEIVRTILSSYDAEVWLMTSALKEKENYSPGDSNWLLSALSDEILAMRRHWQSLFGIKQGAVRVRDSFNFVDLGNGRTEH